MSKFKIIFYTTENGGKPFYTFLCQQQTKMKAKIIRELELLEEFGSDIQSNHSKSVGDGLFELRIKFSSNITRIFYFYYKEKTIIILNGFVKKSQKTPRVELRKARKYKREYIEREMKICL